MILTYTMPLLINAYKESCNHSLTLFIRRGFITFFALMFAATLHTQEKNFVIEGVVNDLYTGKGMPAVNVHIAELQKGTITDSSGYYKIDHLRKGIYTIHFTRIGYKKQNRKINFEKNTSISLSIKMEEQSIVFEAVEVTPGIIELSSEEGASSTVSNQEILSSAGIFSKDVYRSLQTVPGVSNSEWSSKPHIKGGNPDEMAVLIDNLEIYEPFHLEEIDGPYSVISSDLVKDMKLITGGFAPKYGDKMSGILKINTIDRVDDDSIKASIDFSNASAALNQRISDRMNVFFSGRKSYIYLLQQAADNNFPTVVYDIWSKIDYKIDAQNKAAFNFMFLKDQIQYHQDSTYIRREFFDSYKMNYYVWLNWYKLKSENHYYTTTLGFQNLDKHADFSFDGSFTDDNADRRNTKMATLKQDHYWKIMDDHTLEFGFDGNIFFTDYYYKEFRVNPTETTPNVVSTDIIFVDSKSNGYTASGYVQDSYRFSDKINVLIGTRLSGQDYTDLLQIAPRAALSYAYSDKLNFKWAYGWYYQPDNFQKMKTYDNQYKLYSQPEKSIHYVMSAAYVPDPNTGVTADLYYKDYTRLNDDYSFDFSNRIEGVGIIDKPYNTKSGYSTGIDIFLKKRYGRSNLLSVGYSFSISRIRNHLHISTPRDLDRTHSIAINNISNFTHGLTLSSLFRLHTGDPYTPSNVRILGDSSVTDSRVYYLTEKKNSGRLPLFHSLDLKLEKRWKLSQIYLVTYGGIINAYNNDNVRQRAWKREVINGKVTSYVQKDQLYFPRVYTLGLSMEFSVPRSR